jgi:hypothetical protein
LREYCSLPKNRILPVTGHFSVDSLEPESGFCSPSISIVVLSENEAETLFVAQTARPRPPGRWPTWPLWCRRPGIADVEFAIWRKKADESLFEHNRLTRKATVTPIKGKLRPNSAP